MPLLEASGLSMAFGGLRAVHELDLAVQAGEITGLIGPNGSGKTTVFNLISGLYRATAGRIFFDRDRSDLVGRAPHTITKLGIARTFQNQRLFNQMTVLENVLVGMHCRTRAGPGSVLLALPGARAERRRAVSRRRDVHLRPDHGRTGDHRPRVLGRQRLDLDGVIVGVRSVWPSDENQQRSINMFGHGRMFVSPRA
jgi:branched-chain amino acid transport system ATP-binding protein